MIGYKDITLINIIINIMPPKLKILTPEESLRNEIVDKLEDGIISVYQYRDLMEQLAEGKIDNVRKMFDKMVSNHKPKVVYVEPEPEPLPEPPKATKAKKEPKTPKAPKPPKEPKVKGPKKPPPPKTPKEIIAKLLKKNKINMYVYHDLMEKLNQGKFSEVMSSISAFTGEQYTQPDPSLHDKPVVQHSQSIDDKQLLMKIRAHAQAIIDLIDNQN
jgi:hypothetical protein